jgi:formylglycine-generating enzyme required for sulfatase activity/DNA-binding HxlR family transcriptional regulator
LVSELIQGDGNVIGDGSKAQVLKAERGSTVRDVIQAVIDGQIVGDVHIGPKIYTQSSLEELHHYLARATANYERRMYQTILRPPLPPLHPYKSLYPFEIEDFPHFFGREATTRRFYAKTLNSRLTVLHGRSGAGKTSLLNAGLFPRLIHDGRLPVYVRIRAHEDPTLSIKQALAPASAGPRPQLLEELSLQEFLGLVSTYLSRQTNELVVILDQFEEFLVSLFAPDLRRPFIEALGRCYEDKSLSVRFIVALRRERLWELDEFEEAIPHILDNRYGLSSMSDSEVIEVITRPVSQKGVSFEPALLERLLKDLKLADLDQPEIELTHLQIVCAILYDSLPEGENVIAVSQYQALGGIERILANYLNDTLLALPPELHVTARNILKELVSSTATNRILSVNILQRRVPQDPRLLEEVLDRLVDKRLVRRQDSPNVPDAVEYELPHTYLAEEIIGWIDRDGLEAKEAEELLERELASWRVNGTLVSAERLGILCAYVEYLELDSEAQRLLLMSALDQGHDASFWIGQVEDQNWAISQVADYLTKAKGKQRRLAGDLRSNLDSSFYVPLTAALSATFKEAKGAEKRDAARVLFGFRSWLSANQQLGVIKVLGPIWALQGFTAILVLILLYMAGRQAWPFVIRERAIPGSWMMIPEGSFVMGVDEEEAELACSLCLAGALESQREYCPTPEALLEWSGRRSDARLPTFFIMENEVTNAQYKLCVDVGVCRKPANWVYDNQDRGSHAANKPVTGVSWSDAMTHCQWLGGRLPTEEEWEKAARGPGGKYFPWGNEWDPSKANLEHSGSGGVQSITSYAETDISDYQVRNLAGNVQEWTASKYVAFSSTPFENCVLPLTIDDSVDVVVRGGAWHNVRSMGMGAQRGASWFSAKREEIGFRCVCPPDASCESPWGLRWVWFGEY